MMRRHLRGNPFKSLLTEHPKWRLRLLAFIHPIFNMGLGTSYTGICRDNNTAADIRFQR